MGLLRFLLATSVLSGHSSPVFGFPMLDAGLAVKTFFMISGFYMTLILTSKYHVERGGYWLFISNRFLRIYPSYLVVLAVSALFYAAASIKLHTPADRLAYWVQAWQGHHYGALAGITISQFTIFGLDVTPLLDFSPAHGFGFIGAFGDTAIRAWRFNFLPHAWSISVELFFYLLAPFICVARRWVQVALVALALAFYGAADHWLSPDLAAVMGYHFFPFQLGYLVLGVLSFHLLHPLFERGHIHKGWSWAVLLPLGVIILFYGALLAGLQHWLTLLQSADVIYAVCIGLGFFAIPLLFNLSRRAKLDRFVGDLSYPMYLSHIVCKWVILATMGVAKKNDDVIVPGWELLLLTVVVSIGLVWLVDYPVDRWRQARVAAMTGAAR